MSGGNFLFTSESVTEGHPDKLCDRISDAVLDEVLKQDRRGRVACETFVTTGLVIVGGEITTSAYVDIHNLVRATVKDIGYTDSQHGFAYNSCAILNAIGSQSPDIAQGVDTGGAGDQGLMSGYACRETKELMPMPIMLAHRLTEQLANVRKKKTLGYLGPDGKSQVTIEYKNGKPARADAIVISTQHTEEILDRSGKKITRKAADEIIAKVVKPIVPKRMIDKQTKFYINPTGKFVIGGPQSDTGMTGRKIIVDTYGGMASHGGGAFSGKDPTKVDRSASYMARYIAKNVVASGLADKCTLQLAYAIGVAEPVSMMVFTDETCKVPEERIVQLIRKHFDLTPRGIIKDLKLLAPIYSKTAAYGHFGRNDKDFTWEKTDKAKRLARDA
ncbi:MAG: methionine adenosyltransferase [candidate division Zixibacteria bacterium]|nr:methionine adenosyltransferase [candidate division Zixibacteria bacterium]MDH3938083.1 methionine adenosyltransferase [candidate division Zixibacteria bacterium]MDH4035616.1 methionine adenosyltransferase [candidate division Zixibacteria bacterium]